MSDARILSHSLPLALPLSAANMSGPQSAGDELSDEDLEHVVGGLARTRDETTQGGRVPEPSYTISFTAEHEIAHRVSA